MQVAAIRAAALFAVGARKQWNGSEPRGAVVVRHPGLTRRPSCQVAMLTMIFGVGYVAFSCLALRQAGIGRLSPGRRLAHRRPDGFSGSLASCC